MNKKLKLATALLLIVGIFSNLAAQGWLQRYGTGSERTSAQAIARTADNGYIFCGYSDGGTQLYIVKTDPEGSVLATRKYKTADDVQDVVKMVDAGDGTFLIAFTTKIPLLILKIYLFIKSVQAAIRFGHDNMVIVITKELAIYNGFLTVIS